MAELRRGETSGRASAWRDEMRRRRWKTKEKLIASTSNGSPAGRRRSGKSSVFSLFNLKERSKFWSEAVIRGDFDDLESSSPGKMGAFNYTKADNRTV
ncbi:hypothetical protein LguiA_007316 [Lonicera macranthoides]